MTREAEQREIKIARWQQEILDLIKQDQFKFGYKPAFASEHGDEFQHLHNNTADTFIQMRYSNTWTTERCSITNELVELGGWNFFLNGDYGYPVLDEIALAIGFKVCREDWNLIRYRLDETDWQETHDEYKKAVIGNEFI